MVHSSGFEGARVIFGRTKWVEDERKDEANRQLKVANGHAETDGGEPKIGNKTDE